MGGAGVRGLDGVAAGLFVVGAVVCVVGFTSAAISGGSAGEGFLAGIEPTEALLALGSGTPSDCPTEAALGVIGFGTMMVGSGPDADNGLIFLSAAERAGPGPAFLIGIRTGANPPGGAGDGDLDWTPVALEYPPPLAIGFFAVMFDGARD